MTIGFFYWPKVIQEITRLPEFASWTKFKKKWERSEFSFLITLHRSCFFKDLVTTFSQEAMSFLLEKKSQMHEITILITFPRDGSESLLPYYLLPMVALPPALLSSHHISSLLNTFSDLPQNTVPPKFLKLSFKALFQRSSVFLFSLFPFYFPCHAHLHPPVKIHPIPSGS